MLLFCLNILVLVFLAAPARSRHLPETILGFKTAPKHQEKPESEQSRIRPPSPGGPRKTRPRQALAASIKASQLFTRRPSYFEHSSPIQHQNLAQRPLPLSGDWAKDCIVYRALIYSRRAIMIGGDTAANSTREEARG